jgi:hypothetical protein
MDCKVVILYARLFYLLLPIFGSFNTDYSFNLVIYTSRFSSEDISGQNQVKASVQRKIRQSIADEVLLLQRICLDLYFLFLSVTLHNLLPSLPKLTTLQYPSLEPLLDDLLPKKSPMIVVKWLVVFLSCSACLLTIHYVFLVHNIAYLKLYLTFFS